MLLKIHFLIRLRSDHSEISMANANIDAGYVGSLRIKISLFFSSNFTFYKWCVTKVAHCMVDVLVFVVAQEIVV